MHDGRHDMCEECDRYYDAAQLELRKLKNWQPPADTKLRHSDACNAANDRSFTEMCICDE